MRSYEYVSEADEEVVKERKKSSRQDKDKPPPRAGLKQGTRHVLAGLRADGLTSPLQ